MKLTKTKPQKTILSAIEQYIEFIAPTYGPAGKKTLIVQNEFTHEAVDDGKRSAQAFEIEDELENAVIQYVRETTQKGKDGTTTAALIMSSIVSEAFKNINNDFADNDYHGMFLSLKKGLNEAIKKITASKKNIKTKEELYAIAYNSYNNEEIAKLIADTIHKIGKDGVLSIDDSRTSETTVDVVNGLELPKGYYSPYLMNIPEGVALENPDILLVNRKINLFSELANAISAPSQTRPGSRDFTVKDVVIIADGFGDDVITKCITYKVMGAFRPLLIEIPGYGDKLENLSDIAAIVGARVVDGKMITLDKVTKEDMGTCETIKSLKDITKILGGKGKTKEYIASLKTSLETTTNPFDKDKLTKRIAVLSGGIAVIKVGAYTENEQKSIKTKVENAVNSTQIAFRSGVVIGAGKSLLVETSSELLNTALKAPRNKLMENGAKYLDENAVDPLEVVITALETGVSIAGQLITLGGISANKREEKKEERLSY